jgi:adenosylcobinamide kinase/adenosylcobinamide-phosphate guanylyltransferase
MTCIAVSNEVGLGVVPEHRLGRLYRDLLGKANQALAAQANEVYLMVAGLAVELKALAVPRKKALTRLSLNRGLVFLRNGAI